MAKFCAHERHGGICKKTGTYCNLGACPYEDLKEFTVVRHGKWVNKNWNWYCSECDKPGYKGHIPAEPDLDYCPNCGAKMDGE